MRARRRRRALGLVAVAGLALGLDPVAAPSDAAGARPAAPEAAAASPLRILLTNDDGFAAPGIRAVRDALVAAGHDVTIVAPATDQSGSSGRVTFTFGGTIAVRQEAAGVWSVAGSPADSVLVGLATVFVGDPPDLVVSGSNIGQNAGGLVGHSGTVGAAVTALEEGIPALAVSTELDPAAGSGATLERFDDTAAFVVDVIATLQESAGSRPLLPSGRALNVNYPVVTVGDQQPDGVAFTQVGRWSFVEAAYQPAGTDTYRIVPVFPPFQEPVPQADTTALRNDRISISVLDGNLGLPLSQAWPTLLRLEDLD